MPWVALLTRYHSLPSLKVGAWFRDCLHEKYRSSSKAKHARKMAKRVSFNELDPDDIMNFSLDFEIDLPEVDDAFYEEVVRRESMVSAGESVQSEELHDEDSIENITGTDQNRHKETKRSDDVQERDSSESSDEQIDDDIFNSSSSSSSGSFYDIDDMSFALVPFDALEP